MLMGILSAGGRDFHFEDGQIDLSGWVDIETDMKLDI